MLSIGNQKVLSSEAIGRLGVIEKRTAICNSAQYGKKNTTPDYFCAYTSEGS